MPRIPIRNFTASRALLTFLVSATALWVIPATARGQVFVTNRFAGTIGEYSTSGGTVNAALVSGLHQPLAIAVVPQPSTWARSQPPADQIHRSS